MVKKIGRIEKPHLHLRFQRETSFLSMNSTPGLYMQYVHPMSLLDEGALTVPLVFAK